MRVRPEIRVRPDVCVWPGDARLASKAHLASKARFTSRTRTMPHQQNGLPPANRRPASKLKRAPQTRASSHGGRTPTGEQAGPDGTPPKALNVG